MFDKIQSFHNSSFEVVNYGNNLCFVSNNLKNYEMSNLLLTASLNITDFKSYPTYDFGDTVFDIDSNDVCGKELIYFKSNILTTTSVENLQNFNQFIDSSKMILIDRVIKYIKRELDYSSFYGTNFNDYVKMKMQQYLSQFLQSLVGSIITGYKINSIQLIKKTNFTGAITVDFSVTPVNSLEEFRIITEV